MCNNLRAPTNGLVIHGNSTDGKTPFGEMATFFCNEGYVLEGTEALTCLGNTTNGQFDGRPPSCERK